MPEYTEGNTIIKAQAACSFYNFKTAGISIEVNDKDTIDAIFLYSEGQDGYRQYKKSLPFGIKFTNNRKEMLEKFGKPSHSFSGYPEGNYQCSDSFDSKGLTINYNTTDSTNMLATISYIILYLK